MNVRTYGRRNRAGGRSSYSQTTTTTLNDTELFWSQESSSSHFDFSDTDDVVVVGERKAKKSKDTSFGVGVRVQATATLMETQESGEMMEHVDEVNFAIDGLRKGQPLRIRRASLVSLLGICSTSHCRRLLRTQGMARTIVDAVLGINFDDSPSNLAAATLFYVLTMDGQDDQLLESPSCIHFLIKLLKPIVSAASRDKAPKLGSKLLAVRKAADVLQDQAKSFDSVSEAILSKVEEILVSCRDTKSSSVDDGGVGRVKLSAKWIALLTMEKACVSTISLEDTSGMVRKTGGNFKEKLRELGGLDAVFEVTMKCHSVLEKWKKSGMPSVYDTRDDLESLVLLVRCLKIMENATFLSNENQCHLLKLKGDTAYGSKVMFTELVLEIIKALSGLYLLKWSSAGTNNEKSSLSSDVNGFASRFAFNSESKDSDEVIYISSSEVTCSVKTQISSERSSSLPRTSCHIDPLSVSDNTTASLDDTCSQMMRVNSSASGSCSRTSRSSNSGLHNNEKQKLVRFDERCSGIVDVKSGSMEESQDPFAFDEGEFKPSKWDLLFGKPNKSRTRKSGLSSKKTGSGCQSLITVGQPETSPEENQPTFSNGENSHSQEISSSVADKERMSLLSDCLLTAVKVLMNLANDNPIGCQHIAACGGLETLSSLIAHHFPSFSSSPRNDVMDISSSIELSHQDRHLNDDELDFLVAILGLLVNLVEKDGHNRSRLAASSVFLHSSEGTEEEKHQDVIPLLCAIFLANQGAGEATGEGNVVQWKDDEMAMQQGEKEAEKMIVEAYAALLLAFLSTDSRSIRGAIAECLPDRNLAILVPVLERFLAFHVTLNMIAPETQKAVTDVIESCKVP